MSSFIEFNFPDQVEAVSKWATIAEAVTGKGRYIIQTRCPGDFGVVELRLEPYVGPTQFLLEWQVANEQIPEEFLPGVIKGVQQAAQQERDGFNAVIDIRVIVNGGNYHPVDSRSSSYTKASALAFADALSKTHIVPLDR